MVEHTPTIDLDAEQYLIAAILSDNKIWDIVGDRLSPDIFYSAAHRHIIGGAQRIADKGELVDFVSISQYLRDAKLLDAVGGDARLLDLSESTPVIDQVIGRDPRKIEQLCDRLMACYQRRQLSAVLKAATDTLKDPLQPIEDILGAIEKQVIDIRRMAVAADAEPGLWTDVTEWQLEEITNQLAAGEINQIVTGVLERFDDICNFQPGDLVGLIGAPGSGKTALACWLALNYAKMGYPTVFLTLEQTVEQLWARITSAITGINNLLLGRKRHLLTESQLEAIAASHWDNVGSSNPLPMYICPDKDRFHSAFLEFEIHLKRSGNRPPSIVFVDHLQHLVETIEPQLINEQCKKWKDFAKKYNVVVVLLVQPPDLSGRNDKRPSKGDISGAKIAWQFFDVVIGQHREGHWDENSPDPFLVNLRLLKNRHGGEGSCDILVDFPTCRFTQASSYEY